MTSRDVAISSREVSVQVIGETIKIAQVGVPGPVGPQGPGGPQGSPAWGRWEGEWNSAQAYTTEAIVSYNAGSGFGTYYCVQNTQAGIAPTNTDYWDVLASPPGPADPGAQGIPGPAGPVGLVARGEWAAGQAYKLRDWVRYDGSSWYCRRQHTSVAGENPYADPDNNWVVLAAAGAKGDDGDDGKTVRNGEGAPASGLGVVGDFYIDTENDRLYGPKTSSGWGSGVSLKGPQGPAGKTLAWVSLHFEQDGDLRVLVPEAAVLKTSQIIAYGTGEAAVFVNGDAVGTGDVTLAAGDRIVVQATGVSGDYLVTLPIREA